MPQATRAKSHEAAGVRYDALTALAFPAVTLAINQTNATVQARIPLPTDFKIFRVTALPSGTVAGTCSVNVVLGTGAEGSQGTPDNIETTGSYTKAAAGNILLSADSAVTMTADTVTQINVDNPHFDVIWPTGGELTLRTVTNGTASGTLQVVLLGKFYDTLPTKPINQNFDATAIA